MERNQARVVQGYVDEELLWKVQRCLVGESVSLCDIKSLEERMAKLGLGEISVKRIQGRFFLLEVPDDELMELVKQNDQAYLKEFLTKIEPWLEKILPIISWPTSTRELKMVCL